MSMISKQVDELRKYADEHKGEISRMCRDAADTIETLSAADGCEDDGEGQGDE